MEEVWAGVFREELLVELGEGVTDGLSRLVGVGIFLLILGEWLGNWAVPWTHR